MTSSALRPGDRRDIGSIEMCTHIGLALIPAAASLITDRRLDIGALAYCVQEGALVDDALSVEAIVVKTKRTDRLHEGGLAWLALFSCPQLDSIGWLALYSRSESFRSDPTRGVWSLSL